MLPFTYKRLPVNTNSTCTLSIFKSHLEYILYCDVQGKKQNRRKKQNQKQNKSKTVSETGKQKSRKWNRKIFTIFNEHFYLKK